MVARVLLFKKKDETIGYEAGVAEVHKLKREESNIQWRLGEIAARLEPKYGDKTLERFAEEVKINYSRMRHHKRVFEAYFEDQNVRYRTFSYSAAEELVGHPNRMNILERRPNLSVSEARKIMQAYNDELNKGIDDEEDAADESEEEDEPVAKKKRKGKPEEDDYDELHRQAKSMIEDFNLYLVKDSMNGVVRLMRKLNAEDRDALRASVTAMHRRIDLLLKSITELALKREPITGETSPASCDT